jgi:hypothetical protein
MMIDVSKDVEHAINAAVQSGQFASAGEMIDTLVHEYQRRTRPQPATQEAADKTAFDVASRAGLIGVLDMVDELRKNVPPEEFSKLPTDGARQLDHYLYGSPKRPPS